jgi:nucleotide-binding universal stress UspA family protein
MSSIKNKNNQCNYLTINEIDSSPRLAMKLPPHLAQQYHAIPIASDLRCVTIAMADPEDPEARDAIQSAVMIPATLVRADSTAIDSLIAKCYPASASNSLNFFACKPGPSVWKEQENYIRSFSALFNANLNWFENIEKGKAGYLSLRKEIKLQNPDLLIISRAPSDLLRNLCLTQTSKSLAYRCQISLLSINKPLWPLRKILLVLQNDLSDACAVEWAVRLARSSQATLTLLPILPPVPSMYADLQYDLSSLLVSNCPLGRHLRRVARHLVDWEIQGTFKIRDEYPEWQIQSEVNEGEFDLLILGADHQNIFRDLMIKDLVLPILDWAPSPVLITQTIH